MDGERRGCQIAASDWGNLVIRRASKAPVDKGGWNVFGTGAVGSDGLDPTLNAWLRTNGEAAWFGWPSDGKIEALRQQWIEATDTPTRKELAAAMQARAFEVVPYIPTGQGADKTAYRKILKGLILGPALFQWYVERA